jgi:hypothetical protein
MPPAFLFFTMDPLQQAVTSHDNSVMLIMVVEVSLF